MCIEADGTGSIGVISELECHLSIWSIENTGTKDETVEGRA